MVFHCGQMLNKMFTLNNSRNLFFLTLWILSILLKVDGTVWNDITACYGADDDCSRYQMQCPAGTSIILGKLMYGTKWLQNCQYGISNCKEKDKVTACCGYNSSDTFTPFSQRNMSAIFENCEGKVSCEGWAPRLAKTPYSSYVWMQYACVNDNNRTDMCQNKTISGTDLFIRFNMSSSNLQISANTQKDCSCQILTPGCNVAMFTTLVDLDFNLPKLDTATAGCSTSSLEFVKQNKTYQCQNTELFKKGHTFERMTEINLHATNETVSMKNIIAANDLNGPNYIVLYFKTFPQQPLLVKCFAPGVEMSISKLECPITKVTTKSTSAQQITTKSSSSKLTSSFKASHHRTTPSVSMTTSPFQSSMSLNSVSSHSVTKNASSSFQTHTSNTPTTLESVISLTTLRSLPTLSSKNVSRPSTEQLTKQSATDFPSSYRPNLTPSVTRSRSYQPSVSPSVHSDSVPTSSSTIFASVNSESSSTNGIALRSTDTNSGLHSVSVDVTSSPTHTTTSTQTTIDPVLNTTSSKMYASSESTNRTISTDVETTNLVDQNSKNSLDISSINTEITTHSSAVTTRKTKDDDGNNNNGLIIGITVGMVILLMIIVAVITVLLCLRIKRKEKVRRNYIRNTNIFYSFPEDYGEAGNTVSDSSPEMDRGEPSFSTIPRSQIYDGAGNTSPSLTKKNISSPVYFDQYKIKSLSADDNDDYEKDTLPYSRMPSDSTYTGETSNETIDFVNGIENADSLQVDSNSNIQNGGKTVTFDPSILYAKVRNEGKTKF